MVKKSARKKSQTKLAWAVLGLIILVIIVGKITQFITSFYSPIQDGQIEKNYVWGNSNINVLINTEKISLLSYNPNQKKLVVLNIPDGAYLNVSQDRGNWLVSSLYSLGGNKLFVSSVSNFLALPIDGYIQLSSLQIDVSKMVEDIRTNPFKIVYWGQSVKSNLSRSELYRLLWGISRARFDRIEQIGLEKVLDRLTLADKTEVLVADPVKIDSLMANFFDDFISEERLEIAVVNATDIPGLASKAARMVENMGGDVIITTTSSSKSSKTVIFGKEGETLTRLAQVFDSDCLDNPKCDKISIDNLQLENRADVILILGEDFADRF